MDLSSSSTPASDPPSIRWAQILGTAIAILTLLVPILSITYYSSSDNRAYSPPNTYVSESLGRL